MSKNLYIIVVLLFFVSGCAQGLYKSEKTSLQLQAFQAKTFETTKRIAFASTLSVLQDLGYIIEAGDFDTGLISAKSPTQGGYLLFRGTSKKFRKVTAFIEPFGNKKTRVRLNYLDSINVSSPYGQNSGKDFPVEDPKIYQDTFEGIQKAIFVRTNN